MASQRWKDLPYLILYRCIRRKADLSSLDLRETGLTNYVGGDSLGGGEAIMVSLKKQ